MPWESQLDILQEGNKLRGYANSSDGSRAIGIGIKTCLTLGQHQRKKKEIGIKGRGKSRVIFHSFFIGDKELS